MKWKKGQSGNPRGRPVPTPLEREYKLLCSDESPALLKRVLELAAKSDDLRILLKLLDHMTDRAFGKPAQSVAMAVEDNREQTLDALPVHEQAARLRKAADELERRSGGLVQ